jgi:hypothetical protein
MYDYATSVYEKKKYAALTQISRFITTAFPKQSRQHLIIQAELLIEGQEDQSLQRLLAIFPTISLSDPDRAVLPTSFLMPIIKERQGKRKDG